MVTSPAKAEVETFLASCLSNRYVNRFFLSSGNPSSNENSWASSRRTSWEVMITAAADSRINSDEASVRA